MGHGLVPGRTCRRVRPSAAQPGGLHLGSGGAAAGRDRCPTPPSEQPRYNRYVAVARAAIGDSAAFDLAWQEGRAMTLEHALEYALKGQDA